MQGAHIATALADPNARLLALAAGVTLLVLGRRLFWLFVGIVGFFTVYQLSLDSLHLPSPGLRLFLALLAGLFGVLLAIFVQRVAVGIAGFLVGAWLAAGFLGIDVADIATKAHGIRAVSASPGARPWVWAVVLVAGILAAILALRLFELALIALSSLAGAGLIVDAAHLAGPSQPLFLVVLAVAGIAIQAGWTGRRARARRPS